MPGAFHAETLLHGLAGLRFGHPVHLYLQIGSTNDEAKHLASAGAPEGLLVVAEEQTAGRGRAGRRWITPSGKALAFSLVLRPNLAAQHAPRLTMLAGVAACEAIEQICGVPAALKWPNDVLVSGKKVGGILVETALDGARLLYAVMGVGINVSFAPSEAEVDFPATSLQAETHAEIDRLALLRTMLERLDVRYPRLESAGGGALYGDWRARLTLMGKPIVAHTPDGVRRGQAEGVDADGALIVRLESGDTLRLSVGDVRLRPAAESSV